jgi:hypothetical protein
MAFAVFASLKQNDPYTFTNSWTLPCINKLELPKNPEQRVETANWLHGWVMTIFIRGMAYRSNSKEAHMRERISYTQERTVSILLKNTLHFMLNSLLVFQV